MSQTLEESICAPPPERKEYVYVILNRLEGICKIGFSQNPYKRESGIRCQERLGIYDTEFIGCIPGGRKLEASFHKRFQHKRVRGEWFTLDDNDIREIVGRHRGLEYHMKGSKVRLQEALAEFEKLPHEDQVACIGPSHPDHPGHQAFIAARA